MMDESTCPATPPLSRCSDTPPLAGPSKLSPSRWDSPDRKEKSRSPTPNRPSSPENCAICLGQLTNKSFTNSCCHQFCFVCLLEWSKVKAECPLCKVAFESIIHNVRSQDDYDQYHVVRQEPPRPTLSSVVFWTNARASIQYHHRAFSEWMANHGLTRYRAGTENVNNAYLPGAIPAGPPTRIGRRGENVNGTSAFRRSIYERDLWARLQPDVTGRYRDCSPEFYSQNPAQTYRLVPFLNRELNVLLENGARTMYVLEKILELLPLYNMMSTAFRCGVARLIGHQHAPHFCHELRAFASSPYDLVGYDRAVQYHPNGGAGYSIELDDNDESPESNRNSDDDIQVIESSPEPSTSRGRPSVLASAAASSSAGGSSCSIPPSTSHTSIVNVSSDSDSDNAEDVQVVGFVKPRHERTPEVITLSSPEHSSFMHPQISHESETPRHSRSPNDLICINLGSSATAQHRWHDDVNEISSDESSAVSSSPHILQHRVNPLPYHLEPVSSESILSSSPSSDDERGRKETKGKRYRKQLKSRNKELSELNYQRDSTIVSDSNDGSQPSTSTGQPSQRLYRYSITPSPKSPVCTKTSISSSKDTTYSDSDDSPPRTVLRSAIVQRKYIRAFTSSEEDDTSPSCVSRSKKTLDEPHSSRKMAENNASQEKVSDKKHSRYQSSGRHSRKSPSHHKHRSPTRHIKNDSDSKRKKHSHSGKGASTSKSHKNGKKRQERSRSSESRSKKSKRKHDSNDGLHSKSSKRKQKTPKSDSSDSDELNFKSPKKNKRPLRYSDEADSDDLNFNNFKRKYKPQRCFEDSDSAQS